MRKKCLLYIGNNLASKGRTVTSVETLGAFLRQEGYTVYTASSVSNKLFRLLDMLWAVFKYNRKVDLVLIDTYSTQNFHFAVAVGNLCRLLRLPYIPILRGGDLPSRLKRSAAASWKLFNGAKTNVAPSGYLMEQFKAEGYTNLTPIPNTIQLNNYIFKERSTLGPRLLWVRSFAEIYNPMLALEIVDELKEKGLDVSLCMVGPDKDGSLAKCEQEAGIRELPVTFTGRLSKSEWIELAADYDIFINTTNFDNTPVSVIEAMALGLPVISTNVGGIPFLLEDGVEALVVPPGDAEVFVKAIQRLLNDPELVTSLVKAARTKAEQFDWKNVRHQWNTVFDA